MAALKTAALHREGSQEDRMAALKTAALHREGS